MTLLATWWPDGTRADLRDDGDYLWARLKLVDDWYPDGSRSPVRAWVVEWLDESDAKPQMVRSRLGAPAEPAVNEGQMVGLSEEAANVARGGTPAEPLAFGHASTGLVEAGGVYQRVVLLSHAVQEASGRLHEAAGCTEEWAADRVVVALTEAIAWVRALDDAMSHLWRNQPQPAFGRVTRRIDAVLDGRGWDPRFVEWAKAQRTNNGYGDWTIGLVVRGAGLPRDELRAVRWLAGKMLHFGPLPAAELKQWRAGEPPRWKWRQARDIFPRTRGQRASDERAAYDRALAGRDVVGTFNLFNPLLAAEFLAHDLTAGNE